MKVENNRGDDYLDLNINDEFRLADIVQETKDVVDERYLHTFDSLVSG